MRHPIEIAALSVEIGKRHVAEQQARILRQRALIAELEKHGHEELVSQARAFLCEMFACLDRMQDDYIGAQSRLTERQKSSSVERPIAPQTLSDN
jgi:hypothetical protein